MGLTTTTSTLTGNKWLFAPTVRDEQIVEQERERLASEWPGVRVTRTDAIRSLFLRGSLAPSFTPSSAMSEANRKGA